MFNKRLQPPHSREWILYISWHPQYGALWQDTSSTAHIINLRVVFLQIVKFIYLWCSNVEIFEKLDSVGNSEKGPNSGRDIPLFL
jgi:hypothetical protein